jgi:hypothetical protein
MTEQKVSVYTILNNWLYDGKKESKIPQEVLDSYQLGAQYILYFFRGSRFLPYISKTFNNYYVYQLDKEEVFTMLKDIVIKTKFRPSFFKTASKAKIKLVEALRKKFPTLKIAEVNMLANKIDNLEDKDSYYETLGLKKGGNKKRTTKQQWEQIQQESSYDDCIMEVDAEQAIKEIENQICDDVIPLKHLLEHFTIEGT